MYLKDPDSLSQLGTCLLFLTNKCFPGGAVVKYPPASAGDARDSSLILESGTSPGVGNGNSLQYSCQENSMDKGDWQATVQAVTNWKTVPDMQVIQQETNIYIMKLEKHLHPDSSNTERSLKQQFGVSNQKIPGSVFITQVRPHSAIQRSPAFITSAYVQRCTSGCYAKCLYFQT